MVFDCSAARPEQVFYGGEIKGESAMTYFDDIGTRVMHTYQVSLMNHNVMSIIVIAERQILLKLI